MIAVLGPGGVGGFLAAALARGGAPVTVVARPETAAHIAAHGIAVRSVLLGAFHAHPAATARLGQPTDALLVATKAGGLIESLERIDATPDLVVPLLNGLDHLPILRERFGPEHVAAGCIRIESDRPAPGEIVQTSPAVRVDLAAEHPGVAPLADTLQAAGIPTRIETSGVQLLWSKLVRLNALALTTSASGQPIGGIRSDPEWRRRLIACIEEAVAVGTAEGARLDAAATLAELDAAHEGLGSSMQRDRAAGRPLELDAIAGAVLRAGARHGIACPAIAELVAEID